MGMFTVYPDKSVCMELLESLHAILCHDFGIIMIFTKLLLIY